MIDPITASMAGSVLSSIGGAILGSDKPKSHGVSDTGFDKILDKHQALPHGVSESDALNLLGSTVEVRGADGSLVKGKVEQVAFADGGGVNLRVQGHDYLNTQVVNIIQAA